MSDLRTKIVSIGTLSAGILLTLVGLAGLVLPIIPGFVLILAGLWMIGRVYKHPLLERLLTYLKRQISNITKNNSERKTGGL